MIDLDDASTYPNNIRKWVIERKNFFLNIVPIHFYECDYIPDYTGEKRGMICPDSVLQIEK